MAKIKKRKSFFRRALRLFITLFLASMVYTVICKWIFPPITITQVGAVINGYGLKRDYVSWSKISDNVKLAAIASEDQLFAAHDGFDWKSLEKSLEDKPNNKRRKKAKGSAASTISQQTAKNVFLFQGHGVWKYVRKAPEFFYTKCIEVVWGKRRILEVYLNVAEMGKGIFGIEAAAQAYFHKPASKLTRSEAAMIIASLPNPKKYTVKPVSKRVQWRSAQILRQMNNIAGDKKVKELLKK